MVKDQLNYCKSILEMFNIKEEDFIKMSDTEIKKISNHFSTAEVLDKQSGLKCGAQALVKSNTNNQLFGNEKLSGDDGKSFYQDTGGCSKILHKCDFEKNEHDLYFYKSKVSKSERNAGCDELPIKDRVFNGTSDTSSQDMKDVEARFTTSPSSNNHPTLKPIKLNERILKLFKTPNEQKIIYPFAGSFSEVIGGYKAGFKNFVGCEINQEYIEIGNARLEYWKNKFDDSLDEMVVEKKIDESQVSLFDLMEEEK